MFEHLKITVIKKNYIATKYMATEIPTAIPSFITTVMQTILIDCDPNRVYRQCVKQGNCQYKLL